MRKFVCWSYSDFRISVNNFVNIGPTEKIKIPFRIEFHGDSSGTIDFEIPIIFKKLEILFLPSLQLNNCTQARKLYPGIIQSRIHDVLFLCLAKCCSIELFLY